MSARRGVDAALKLTVALVATIGIWVSQGGTPVGAHPLGNATVNRYRGLLVAPDGVLVDYVMDLAEIPTVQARADIAQAGGTGPYGTQRCREVADGLQLTLAGSPAPLRGLSDRAELLEGQGGLQTLRIDCRFRTDPNVEVPTGALTFEDTNDPDRAGWQELTLSGHGVAVRSDLPANSISSRLTDYPDAGEAPLQLRSGRADVEVVDPRATLSSLLAGVPDRLTVEGVPAGADRLAALIGQGGGGRWAVLAALGVAAALGAGHGLAPGHGKTVVAAYLVGSRGTRRQAAGLAGIIALSHTSGVFVLGGLTLAASATFPVQEVHAWLRLASAAMVLGLGVWLLTRLRASSASGHIAHTHHDHDHHDDHHDDDHDHHHGHGHGHGHGSAGHRHGLLPHRHNVAWNQLDVDRPLQWRSLLVLGLAGGMVPSASAVIVLLGAVQVGRLAFGAGLIVAFGAGLAAALVGVGLGVVSLSRRGLSVLDQRAWATRLQRNLAPIACTTLLLVGGWLTYRAVLTF